jgi:hypothetical protein
MMVSQILRHDDPGLRLFLASILKKMCTMSGSVELEHVAGRQLEAYVRHTTTLTSSWKKVIVKTGLDFDSFISTRVSNFNIWEELGHGAHGRACLVSGGLKHAVGVLKFFHESTDAKQDAAAEERAWKRVYAELAPVRGVRVVQVMQRWTLLMPWFAPPTRDSTTLAAIEKTLRDNFHKKGLEHQDVKWRNIGVYTSEGAVKVVVFDLTGLRQNQDDGWIKTAVASLREGLA